MPKKSKTSIPVEKAVYLHVYVHKDTKKYYQNLFNSWKTQQINREEDKKSQNYFILDALECLQKSRGIKLVEEKDANTPNINN